MATNDEYSCDFCKRDEGLDIYLTRYIVSTIKSNQVDGEIIDTEIKEYELNDTSLQDISDLKSSIKSEILYRKKISEYNKNKEVDLSKGGSISRQPMRPLNTIAVGKVGSFKEVSGIISPSHYTYRLGFLRSGYVYVYMPHINKWHEYSVTEQGFLNRIDNNNFFSETINNLEGKEPCFKTKDRSKALSITIPRPEDASLVYIKFSDVKWTLKKKQENKNKFKKNMHKFDVQEYLSGRGRERQFPFVRNNLDLITSFDLNEYTYLSKNKSSVYLQNSYTKNNVTAKYTDDYYAVKCYLNFENTNEMMDDSADGLINRFDKYSDEEINKILQSDRALRKLAGAIFCLDDVVGIIRDIGTNALSILEDNTIYDEKEKTLIDIEGLKLIHGLNDDPYFTDSERAIKDQDPIFFSPEEQMAYEFGKMIKEKQDSKKTPEQRANEEILAKAKFIEAKKKDWHEKYEKCLDDSLLKNAISSKQIKDNEKAKKVDELDNWALSFFKKNLINEYYFSITDQNHSESLLSHFELSSSIIEFTKCLPQCVDYLAIELYQLKENQSFLTDTLCCSTPDINKGMGTYINYSNFSTIPWGDLLSRVYAVQTSLNSIQIAQLQSSMSQFLLHLSAIAFRGIQINPKKLSPVPIMIGAYVQAVAKDGVIRANSISQFNNMLTDLFIAYYKDIFGSDVKVSRDSMLSKISNDPTWNFARKNLSLNLPFLDINTISLPREKSHFVKKITNIMSNNYVEELGTYKPIDNKSITLSDIPESVMLDKKISFQHLVATGNFVFQSLAMLTVWNDQNLTGSEKNGKKAATLSGVAMAFTEGASMLLSKYFERKMAVGPLPNSRILTLSKELSRVTDLKHLGWRSLGALVGGIFGVCDIINGYKAIKSGERTYGIFLSLGGGAMVVSSVFILVGLATHPIGLLFLALSIGFAVYALYKREKALQIWMRKSFLGKREIGMIEFGRYETQLSELNGILK